MASLKELKDRAKSVKSTQKITKAMKMVAASKLKKARQKAEANQPYAKKMAEIIRDIESSIDNKLNVSPLLVGTGKDKIHLIIIASSDRGLCGSFNSNLVKHVKTRIKDLEIIGKEVKLLCIGKKSYDLLKGQFSKKIVSVIDGIGRKSVNFSDAQTVSNKVLKLLEKHEFDICSIVFNQFISAISQKVAEKQLIPLALNEEEKEVTKHLHSVYEYEPSEEEILKNLLPKNLAVQIYASLLESAASEQGARMTAMDNASRNASEMIKALNLQYNRGRQAAITKELIEIISGAEAI